LLLLCFGQRAWHPHEQRTGEPENRIEWGAQLVAHRLRNLCATLIVDSHSSEAAGKETGRHFRFILFHSANAADHDLDRTTDLVA
jgi:hypothetical protein